MSARRLLMVSWIRLCLLLLIWLGSIFLFLLSEGRLSESLDSFFEHQSLLIALQTLAARPVPTDFPAIVFGMLLFGMFLIQPAIFKKNWLKFQLFSVRMCGFGVLFLVLGNLIGWCFHRSSLSIGATTGLVAIVGYIFFGTIGLSIWFVRGLKKEGLVSNDVWLSVLYAAFVWSNMSLLLMVLQVLIVSLVRLSVSL